MVPKSVIFVEALIFQLGDLSIREGEILRGVEDQVEGFDWELRLMYAVLEHEEALKGSSEIVALDNEIRDIARDAVDLLEAFVIKQKAKQRRRGTSKRLLFWINDVRDQYNFGMELNGIKVRIYDVLRNRKAYDTGNQSGGRKVCEQTVTVEEEIVLLKTSDVVSSAIGKADEILTQNLVIYLGMIIEPLKCTRDELTHIHSFLKDMKPAENLDERERVWVNDVGDICHLANNAFQSFIRNRELWMQRWPLFKHPVLVFHYWMFRKKLQQIEMKLQVHYDRRWTYGVGKNGSSSRICSICHRRQSTCHRRQSSYNAVNINPTFLFRVVFQPSSLLSMVFTPMHVLASWLLLDSQVESITRDLRLMNALSNDVGGMEDLDKRVKVWLDQTRDVAREANFLVNYFCEAGQPQILGVLNRIVNMWKIELINHKILDMSERKWAYDIGSLRNLQEMATSTSDNVTNNLNEAPPDSSRQCTISNTDNSWIREQVKSIREELNIMCALIEDFKSMEKPNERMKVWVAEMRDVADDAEAFICTYDNYIQKQGGGIIKILVRICSYFITQRKVQKEIHRIKSRICDITERKMTYDIGGIKGRGGQNSLAQNLGEAGLATSESIEGCDNQNRERRYMVKKMISFFIKMYFDFVSHGDLDDQVKSIENEVKVMYAFYQDVQAMEEQDRRLRIWLEEMRVVAREAKGVVDNYHAIKQREHRGIFKNVVLYINAMHPVLHEIRRIKKKIQSVSATRLLYGIDFIKTREASNSMIQSLSPGRPLSPNFEASRIVDQLFAGDKRLSVISTVGKEGTGMTTLAKLIFNDNAVVNHFPCRALVSVPQDYSARAILRDIGEQVMGLKQLKGKKREEEELTQMLNAFLMDKRYFIVLHDVKTTEIWGSLKEAFLDTSNGSRILFVTHKLPLLSDDESWQLFINILKVTVPPELQELGKKIVLRCGGLPEAIFEMGDLLSKKDVTCEEWSIVLEQLNQYQGPWKETFNMIYKDLRICLKKCLNYFILFPEDFEIPARRLITLWVAEGFVNQIMGDEELPEYIAERYLSELIDWNMVQVTKKKLDGKVKKCRLPHSLRELLLSKSQDAESPQVHTSTTSKLSSRVEGNIVHLADHFSKKDASFEHIHGDNTNISLQDYYRDVLSFLSFDTREGSKPGKDVGQFLRQCISSRCFLLLRVLDLEHVFRPRMPNEIGKLSQLRYLGLRWTYLETLPLFIRNLLKLQTLDVKHTYISTLPRSIWKMHQLRHLYLSESYRSRFVPRPSGGSLIDLQTLSGVFVDEESPVKNGLDMLLNLRKLGLSCRMMSSQQKAMESQLEAVADWVQKLKHLQYLRLRSNDGLGRPWDLHLKSLSDHAHLSSIYLLGRLKTPCTVSEVFPNNLINLTLSASELSEDPMTTLDKLSNLKILQLLAASYTGEKMQCCSGGFRQLQVLKLWKLENLKEWDVGDGALRSLRDLEIRSCRRLEALPDELQHVETLRELKLSDMPKAFTARIEKGKARIGMNCNICIDDWSYGI